MPLVLTTAGKEIRRRLASAMLAGLARGADRRVGLAFRVVDSLPFFPLTSGVGRALARKVGSGDQALVGFIARLGRELSERSMEKFVTNLLVNAWVDGRPVRERFRREEGYYPPNFVVLSPTMRCNFRCPGCWAAMYENVPNMETQLLERVISECKEDLGIRFFTIAGGEPFIRRDLLDLYERHDDCYFQVYTNGVLIDEEVAARLGDMGNVAPMLSVEGGRRSTDRRRGPGTYARLEKVRSLLSDAGVLHGFAATATRENVYEIVSDEFIDEMIDQGALVGWYFHYIPIGADPDPARMITARQRDDLRTRVFEIRNSRPIFLADFWNDGPAVQGCMAGGRRYLHINPNGDIEPCVFVHFAVDNVRRTSIREALRSPFMRAIRDGIPYDGNLLRPCMIIDRPEVLRRHCREHCARPTHPGAASILSELADALDDGASSVAEVMDGVWERGEWQHLYVTAAEIEGDGTGTQGAPGAVRTACSGRRH
jgi:MoaA/NifB/PqqE/SkfB family radical SAM enzyme